MTRHYIPTKIKVGHQKVKVKFYQSLKTDKQSLLGIQSTARQEIGVALTCPNEVSGVSEPVSRSMQEAVFLHETLHYVDQIYGGARLTEAQVLALSHGLYQVLTESGMWVEEEK